MDFKELRKYQKKERTSSMLCSLPDTFFEDVAKYASELEANKEYDLLKNVYSITSLIKEMRLRKLFDKSLYYVHHQVELDEVYQESNVNGITSIECAMFLKILSALYEYDQETKIGD